MMKLIHLLKNKYGRQIERILGVITDSRVPLSDDLVRQFKHNTSALLGESKLFQPVANYPYYHMKSEPFWQP